MSINLSSTSTIGSREERLGSIAGYCGSLQDLNTRVRCGGLRERERCFTQSSSCQNMCCVGMLTKIRDVAVIYHSPSGCMAVAADALSQESKINKKRGTSYNTKILSTDMNESDTIFGAPDALYDIIIETYRRYKPNAIFVAASCVSGIIGEDLDAVTANAADALPIPVAPLHCEGFKSKLWASGFDAADHAVLTTLVKPPREKRNLIVFRNFNESARSDIEAIFKELGTDVQFVYSTCTVSDIAHLSEAKASVAICSTLGTYLGNGLQQQYGVPYIQTLNPIGIRGFEMWLRKIAQAIGAEEKAEEYIRRERSEWLPKIEEVKEKLSGLRVVIGMGGSFAYQVARVAEELGMRVVHIMSWHLDPQYDNGEKSCHLNFLAENAHEDYPVSVADQQNFEIISVLNHYKPDLYLSRHPGNTIWAIKQGIPAHFMVEEYTTFGYKRFYQYANVLLDLVTNRSFAQHLLARTKMPYSEWWYRQNYEKMYKEAEA